jgi:hypothetical protein
MILTFASAQEAMVSPLERTLLPGVGSSTCGVVTAMESLKVKVCSLALAQWMVQTSSITTSVLTGRLAEVGLPVLGMAVQSGGAEALAEMLTATGP